MHEHLIDKLKTLPIEPGCYLMKDKFGTIIYVGKAKKLRNRVNQYFVGAHNFKTQKMVSFISDFDYIVTGTEKEALLLEINLIKKHRPRYNIMFMDDKSYPYIKLTQESYPSLKVVRDAKKDRHSRYFGPFPDATAAYNTMKLLNQIYPLRKCKIMPKKVCLYYHLGQCLGPCEFEIDPAVYKKMSNDIIQFLKGDVGDLLAELKQKMLVATEQLAYEKAKEYRDLIIGIEHISDRQQVQSDDLKDKDVFGLYADKGYLAIQGFFIRGGKLLERTLSLTPLYEEPYEALSAFIVQYYQTHPEPTELILPQEMDIESLQEAVSVKIVQPYKGHRKKLLEMAINNAANNLLQKFNVIERKQDQNEEAMQQLAGLLHREGISRIEIFDNSHIQGQFTVSGMVVYDEGYPSKNDYRLFKLHTQNSDVDSMKEVLYRRYFRLLKENSRMPDLIIVDGGYTQIQAAKQIISSLGLNICICGLAKDEKHRTSQLLDEAGNAYPVLIDSPLFFLLTQMQDEVHRFAITYHRKLRSIAQTKSILDEVSGVGEARKKKLMKHFVSMKRMKEASIEELNEVVPLEIAKKIHEILSN